MSWIAWFVVRVVAKRGLNGVVQRLEPAAYQERFDALARSGVDVHGEARFVGAFAPRTVLDAGCGTGRVAIALAGWSIDVVGVDRDAGMLAEARRRAPGLSWVEADLARMDLGRRFDVVVLAGNVPLFCPDGDRPELVARCGAHVAHGGLLIAGFQLGRGYRLEDYDTAALDAGLVLQARYATWERDTFPVGGADYAVSVHGYVDE